MYADDVGAMNRTSVILKSQTMRVTLSHTPNVDRNAFKSEINPLLETARRTDLAVGIKKSKH